MKLMSHKTGDTLKRYMVMPHRRTLLSKPKFFLDNRSFAVIQKKVGINYVK